MSTSRASVGSPIFSVIAIVAATSTASAQPWFGWADEASSAPDGRAARAGPTLEDQVEDGDVDVEDLLAAPLGLRGRAVSGDVRAGSWLSLVGFVKEMPGPKRELGALVVLGLALDRVAQGSVAQARPPVPPPPPMPPPPTVIVEDPIMVTPSVARRAVAAAWRSAGLGADDARIDAMVSRARTSALLPEARLRALRLVKDGSRATSVPSDTGSYDSTAASLWLEARLTWRLERLLYADDEPTLERVRLDRQDVRARVAGRVVDVLFQWQRAWLAERSADGGTREAIDAAIRVAEAEAVLDVLTSGWFTAWLATLAPPDPRAPP